jgi:hypothetical protein
MVFPNSNLNLNFTPDQHRMLDIYVSQYNQISSQITTLYQTLDNIRTNINMVMFSNIQNNSNTYNSNFRNRNTNANRNRNNRENNHSVFYDYENPISPNVYLDNLANFRNNFRLRQPISNATQNTSTRQNTNVTQNTDELSSLLSNFLNSNVIVRPTIQQIENASRLVRYNEIPSPNSEACAISLERFNGTDNVRQINHCGHIFLPTEFNEWFQSNVRCPVCRFDIRNSATTSAAANIPPTPDVETTAAVNVETSADVGAATNASANLTNENISNVNVIRNPQTNIIDQISFDMSNNAITGDLIGTLTNRLFQTLFNPSLTNNNDHFVYDPSNNILMYETNIRPNNPDNGNNNGNNNNQR